MKLLSLCFGILLSLYVSAQTVEENDTAGVYRAVLDSLFVGERVISLTTGKVVYADLYGNHEAMREQAEKEMAAEGQIFVVWVEQERYLTTVAEVLRVNGITFDTIELKDVAWASPRELGSVLPGYPFTAHSKAPLSHSLAGNFFKYPRVIRLSEILFVKGLDVAVLKASVEKRNNKDEWMEMLVLRKEEGSWRILARIKSNHPFQNPDP